MGRKKKSLAGVKKGIDKIEWLNDEGKIIIAYIKRFKNMYCSNEATKEDIDNFKEWLEINGFIIVAII